MTAAQHLGAITETPWSAAVWPPAEKQTRPREWTVIELVALARMFGVTVDDLLTPAEPTPIYPTCGQEVAP